MDLVEATPAVGTQPTGMHSLFFLDAMDTRCFQGKLCMLCQKTIILVPLAPSKKILFVTDSTP